MQLKNIGLILLFGLILILGAYMFAREGNDSALDPKEGINLEGSSSSGGVGGEQNSVMVETRLGRSGRAFDVEVAPIEVIEDSRCPVDATCIWAGTLRLRARLISGLGEANEVFTLGQSITTEAEEVMLVRVEPAPYAGASISSSDYRFFFEVKKRNFE